ncbi:hypothetical protein ACOT81_17990 [Streptomyces sp. WI04-05B]|uniref:hypothetical protein n=1 Tax=Streptomyces echiniscabiei TaxID=3028708 RepID=UPI003B9C6D92
MASTVVDHEVPLSRQSAKPTRRTAGWKPGIIPFLLPFVLHPVPQGRRGDEDEQPS